MKTVITAIIFLIISSSCMAEGWGSLGGGNEIGESISVYPAWDSYEVASGSTSYNPKTDRNLFYVQVERHGNHPAIENKTYKDLRCEFKANKAHEPIGFSCEMSGISPLAGATYKIEPNQNPKDCSYRYMYTCTRGCNNPATPHKMTQSYWECVEQN